jgi:hypothetical protein
VTLAEAQAAVAAIESALATGERTVQFADRSTTYRSVDELQAALAYFSSQAGRLAGRSKRIRGYAAKGF